MSPNKENKSKESIVFFSDLRATSSRNLLDKVDSLLDNLGLEDRFSKGHLVAIKLHFGEKGNTAYVQPVYLRRIAEKVHETGAMPFLTDTNTLYVGTRTNSVSHLKTAVENGFDFAVTGTPIIIADGLKGEATEEVEVRGKVLKSVCIASGITSASGIVAVTHFKCHEMTGFGGVLKNLGMGCAGREGKLVQHSNCAPTVRAEGCTACGECVLVCPVDAIDIGAVAAINEETCIGCGHCIPACPEKVIDIVWDETAEALQEKMVDHVAGVLKDKGEKCVYITFITDVSPFCDCYGHSDAPIVPDIGILASSDPVAIDQAAADLVNAGRGFENSALTSGHELGGDKFRGVHPTVDWTVQLKCAEELGLGSRSYRLVEV